MGETGLFRRPVLQPKTFPDCIEFRPSTLNSGAFRGGRLIRKVAPGRLSGDKVTPRVEFYCSFFFLLDHTLLSDCNLSRRPVAAGHTTEEKAATLSTQLPRWRQCRSSAQRPEAKQKVG